VANVVAKSAKLPFMRRVGYELPGHSDQCDCPPCEERLQCTDLK